MLRPGRKTLNSAIKTAGRVDLTVELPAGQCYLPWSGRCLIDTVAVHLATKQLAGTKCYVRLSGLGPLRRIRRAMNGFTHFPQAVFQLCACPLLRHFIDILDYGPLVQSRLSDVYCMLIHIFWLSTTAVMGLDCMSHLDSKCVCEHAHLYLYTVLICLQ